MIDIYFDCLKNVAFHFHNKNYYYKVKYKNFLYEIFCLKYKKSNNKNIIIKNIQILTIFKKNKFMSNTQIEIMNKILKFLPILYDQKVFFSFSLNQMSIICENMSN